MQHCRNGNGFPKKPWDETEFGGKPCGAIGGIGAECKVVVI